MNIHQALLWGQSQLSNFDNPKLEAEVLLAEIIEKDRTFLKSHQEYKLSFFQQWKFKRWIKKRKNNIPVAQIIGYKKWAGFQIFVDKNVLIPRDETEILCKKIVMEKRNFTPQKILDIGTGSGAIAIFLAHKFPGCEMSGIDISLKALKIAQKNTQSNDVHIKFLKSDLLKTLKNGSQFDIIVANLPYVPSGMDVSSEVKKEPNLAIFAGSDGLDLVRKLKLQIQDKKIQFSELWLEFLPIQKEAIQTIFSSYQVKFFTDCGGDVFFAKIIK